MADRKTVVGLFHSAADARSAIGDLRAAGIDAADISLLANREDRAGAELAREDVVSDVAADAGIGAALGGIGGLLLGFTAIVIPGIGPVMAAGPLVAALSGAGVGAVAGGLIGSLNEAGIPEPDAKGYADRVRGGDVLVTVNASGDKADRARDVMNRHGAVESQAARDRKPGEGPGSPDECTMRTDNRIEGNPATALTADVSGANPGHEAMSADETRRELREYGKPWPHKEAFDIADSLQRKEVVDAEERPIAWAERAGRSTGGARIYEKR